LPLEDGASASLGAIVAPLLPMDKAMPTRRPSGSSDAGLPVAAARTCNALGSRPYASRHWRRRLFLLAAVLLVPCAALAATMSTWPVETTPPFKRGEEVSPARGHLVAVGGGPGGAGAACFSCHGLQGQGDAGGAFPRLAGLDARYLARQMEDYASGARPNAAMTPISRALSHADRQSAALYYAGLPPPAASRVQPTAATDARLVQWGATLYAHGSAERGIQACANCHGPDGQGINRIYPSLAGQPASYVGAQLLLWREGTRRNDILDVMGTLARRMTDDDIRAVSAYVAGFVP
jgi:cytochrome c553